MFEPIIILCVLLCGLAARAVGLGALILGTLLVGNQKARDLGKNLLHCKDLFLVIGMSGWPHPQLICIAIGIGLLAPLKAPLY